MVEARPLDALNRARDKKVIIYTSDYILDELITILFRRENFQEALRFAEAIILSKETEFLITQKVTDSVFEKAWNLRKKFSDKPDISFTDLTTMVLMQENNISEILTDDNHFLQVGMNFHTAP